MVKKGTFPCKGCEDRKVGCHGSCEKYMEAKVKNDKYLSEMRQIRNNIGDIIEFEISSRNNMKRSYSRKWRHYGVRQV